MLSLSFHMLFLALASRGVFATTPSADCEAAPGLRDAVHGASLMQSGRSTLMATVGQLSDDPFEDLEDSFDSPKVRIDPLLNEDSSLDIGSAASQGSIDTAFWRTFCLDLLVFGVVVFGARSLFSKHEKKQKKSVKAARAAATSTVVSGRAPVDFGPLLQAASAGDGTSWRQLLQEIPGVETKQDACGCTALHVAASCGARAMAQDLLERGAAVNAKEAWEETPLHMAARAGSVDVCELLLAHGADLNIVDSSERTPVLTAARAGKEATCEYLLEQGGDCGGRTSDAELPPLLSALLMSRMIKPLTVKAPATTDCESELLESMF